MVEDITYAIDLNQIAEEVFSKIVNGVKELSNAMYETKTGMKELSLGSNEIGKENETSILKLDSELDQLKIEEKGALQ